MVAISEILALLEGISGKLCASILRTILEEQRNNNVILKCISPYVDNCDDICDEMSSLVDSCCDILKPVNGLICLIDLTVFAVCIYNIFTLEVTTPWIKPTLFAKEKQGRHDDGVSNLVDHHEVMTYGFGYDPATKEHKVICIWEKTTSRLAPQLYGGCEYTGPTIDECCRSYLTCDAVCEVLTVGQNSWRRIDEVPPYYLVRGPVYANGSIYWTNFNLLNDKRHGHHHPKVIVAFDVGSEKFRVIPVPDFILQNCGKGCIVDLLQVGERLALLQQIRLKKSHVVDSLEVGGRLALLRQNNVQESHIVKLWIFDDNLNKENITSNSNWIEETVTLPFCAGRYSSVYFHPVTGTNKIIVEAYRSFETQHIKFAHLYSYNRKKMTFKKVRISGISPLDICRSSLVSSFIKSLRSHHKVLENCPGRRCKFMEII